ncbi:response regulator [Sphingomonas sp. UYEF23]|uniref:response regulator n=1 Tax=Sphingomonas sp. UYEF23 TaxID=1756408 RepID=UPI0033931D57
MRPSSKQRSVVIVDDSRTIQAMLEVAFSSRPEFNVVGFANDAKSAVEMVRRLTPDIVTIDLCMPYLDGGALLELLSDMTSTCKIIVSDRALSNILLTSKLIEAGAAACIAKSDLTFNQEAFFKKVNAAAQSIANRPRHTASTKNPSNSRHNAVAITEDEATRAFPVHIYEKERIDFVQASRLANAERQREFDVITKHVAKLTGFPVCLLTVIDRDTQWVKSSFGIELLSMPREQAFCNYTISQTGIFIVSNAVADKRFSKNPLVTGAPGIRTYAGSPIVNSSGIAVAALCVIDTIVRSVSSRVTDQLAAMSEVAAEMIAQRMPVAA